MSPEPYGDELTIRVYEPGDHDAVVELYHDGHLAGSADPNDNGADIEDIISAYLSDEENGTCFWVASLEGVGIIGTIGVQRASPHAAEMRRLRVDQDRRNRGVGTKLIETGIAFCQEVGYLKVVLDTEPGAAPAIALFQKFGFKLDGTRDVGKLREFYLDLYREPESI